MVTIHNAETNEIIEREMNADEYAQVIIDEENDKKLIAEKGAKAEARTALLAKLGITAEEAQLLLGSN